MAKEARIYNGEKTGSSVGGAGATLVAQWYRICLPTPETWVWSLILEDIRCCIATKPTHHNYWAGALEPGSQNYWSPCAPEPMLCNKKSHHIKSLHTATAEQPPSPQLEKSPPSNKDPAQSKINKQIKLCIYKNKIREIIAYVYAKGHGSIKKSGAGKTGQLHVKKSN